MRVKTDIKITIQESLGVTCIGPCVPKDMEICVDRNENGGFAKFGSRLSGQTIRFTNNTNSIVTITMHYGVSSSTSLRLTARANSVLQLNNTINDISGLTYRKCVL